MRANPSVMEIFTRPAGCRCPESRAQACKLPRLGMEESAIIQRLDHMQAFIKADFGRELES